MEILNNVNDFEWYKLGLDYGGKYHYKHEGQPKEYPCKVVSAFWDDPNGPYTYEHTFVYRVAITCPCCKNVSIFWP